jgi:Domain of unknown function (DUF222)
MPDLDDDQVPDHHEPDHRQPSDDPAPGQPDELDLGHSGHAGEALDEAGVLPGPDAVLLSEPGLGDSGVLRDSGTVLPGEPRTGAAGEFGGPPAEGLSWLFELDLEALLASIGSPRAGDLADLQGPRAADDPDGQEMSLAAEWDLMDSAEGKPRDLTGVIADQLPAGPGLAAWLSNADLDELTDWDLPGVAAAFRRVASWAQARELAAIAAMASRAAARNAKVGVDDDGRPAQVTAEATAEVSLALTMSHVGASWWTNLGVTLRWRLADTGAALTAGTIDVPRARLIAEATAPLQEEVAQAVQAWVLPHAGDLTTGQLRVALRRAVIAIDPNGADERRQNAERRAKVSLYPDDVGTATLMMSNLPGVLAAAAMARLSALARAKKASGAGGGIDLLRAQAALGLLLGTLPLIPPAPGAPPDHPPDPDDGPGPPGHGSPLDDPPGSDPSPDAPVDDPPGSPTPHPTIPDVPARRAVGPRAAGRREMLPALGLPARQTQNPYRPALPANNPHGPGRLARNPHRRQGPARSLHGLNRLARILSCTHPARNPHFSQAVPPRLPPRPSAPTAGMPIPGRTFRRPAMLTHPATTTAIAPTCRSL